MLLQWRRGAETILRVPVGRVVPVCVLVLSFVLVRGSEMSLRHPSTLASMLSGHPVPPRHLFRAAARRWVCDCPNGVGVLGARYLSRRAQRLALPVTYQPSLEARGPFLECPPTRWYPRSDPLA